MTKLNQNRKLWVAVKVERGFLEEAQIFKTESEANDQARLWAQNINPDYDEVGVLESNLR